MAQRTIVELTDDLTGDPADETLRFSFDGKAYVIDLSTKNADAFRKAMSKYADAARREGGATRAAKSRSTSSRGDYDPAAVRAWAASNGYNVNARGRVSGEIVDAYKAAGN